MTRITVEPNWHGQGYLGFLVRNDQDERTIFVQTDWDFPGWASCFGWVACECGATDGATECRSCRRYPGEMIAEAKEFLYGVHDRDEEDQWVNDPGYFPERRMVKHTVTWQDIRRTKFGRPSRKGGHETRSHVVEIPDDMDTDSPECHAMVWKILKEDTDWARDNVRPSFHLKRM